jgi:SAM-dependent methyltransferase
MMALAHPDTCPCCDAQVFTRLPTPGHWIGRDVFAEVGPELKLVRCDVCELAFVNPRPDDALLSRFYAGANYECHAANDNRTTHAKADFVLSCVRQHAPAARRLLDFGAGGGWLIRRAAEQGFEAVGYDVGARSVHVCREQGLQVTSDLDSLPDRAFDAVLMHHVLEHLTDAPRTLRRLAGLLAPHGRIFVEVPNARSLRARLSAPALSRHAGLDERYRAFPIHLLYFSPPALRVLLERAGYEVEVLTSHGFGLDELLYKPATVDDAYASAPLAKSWHAARATLLGPVKARVKHALYSRLLGESLFAVASRRAHF